MEMAEIRVGTAGGGSRGSMRAPAAREAISKAMAGSLHVLFGVRRRRARRIRPPVACLDRASWCIFDNTALGEATANALDLQQRIRDESL